ncbi:MAG TPA: response regulator transcription factor, partial [Acidobacteriota bacterium]|nr:response regulator transcription factor [Acidobacteriota bacterium]
MISIVLADDHHIVRQGLRALLEAESDFRVIGEASNGRDAIELVRKVHPNVLVLDLMMPVLNGIEVTRQLGKAHPQTKIVILSMYANEAYVLETLANGASAYVLKDSNT